MKKIALFGSTGSIGTQSLQVVDYFPDKFNVEVLTANTNADLLITQALKYKPKYVVIKDESYYTYVKKHLDSLDKTTIKAGSQALVEVASDVECYDIFLAAIVGLGGLPSVFEAVKRGKTIALANKEVMVSMGHIFSTYIAKNPNQFLPVDSEHSAIFQCLKGEKKQNIHKVILTASGGPFRGKKRNLLEHVTITNALNHPNWSMGKKISIDSATMMNKGLEMIEAKWLFLLENHQIDIIVHPQSIVHSMVEFIDGSVKALLSLPDMKMSIIYALGFPKHMPTKTERLDLARIEQLHFEAPDYSTFECLSLAKQVMEKGGSLPCVLNSANEQAVHLFLSKKIGFLDIPKIISKCLEVIEFIEKPDYEQILEIDNEVRQIIASSFSS